MLGDGIDPGKLNAQWFPGASAILAPKGLTEDAFCDQASPAG